jgi:hypothetical protein
MERIIVPLPVPSAASAASRPVVRTDRLAVAHVLVHVQGAVLVTSTIEATVFLAFAGPASRMSLALTAGAAVLTMVTAAALGGGSGRARRWTLVAESGVVVVTLVDLVLAMLMTGELLGPVALLAGLVVPVGVIAILRRR